MGALGILKNLLLAFLVLLFIIDFVAVSWIVAFSGTGLNPKFYEQQLEKTNAFETGRLAIADFGANALSEQSSGFITEEEGRGLIKQVISKEWLKSQSYVLIENSFAYLKSEKETLELKISLLEPKQKLIEAGSGLISQKIANSGIPLPGGINMGQSIEQLVSGTGLPDEMDLGTLIGNDVKSQLEQARSAVGMLYSGLLVMIMAGILLLVIMLGLNFRKLKTGAKWVGIALLLGGILAVVSSEFANAMAGQAISQAVLASGQGLPAGIAELAIGFASAFVQGLSSTALGFGIAAIAVGVLFLIFGFGLINRFPERKEKSKKPLVPMVLK